MRDVGFQGLYRKWNSPFENQQNLFFPLTFEELEGRSEN